jgi:hypothetical protein
MSYRRFTGSRAETIKGAGPLERYGTLATLRKDGSAVTTHGVETQICRKEEGK